MRKIIFLSLIICLFMTTNLYAEWKTVPATVDEINQYLPADLKSQLNKGEMLLKYFGDRVILLSREEVLQYVTITKTTYSYEFNNKQKQGLYYYVHFKKGQSSISYPIGEYLTGTGTGMGDAYWKANYFGCYMTPLYIYQKGKFIDSMDMGREGICADKKFYR